MVTYKLPVRLLLCFVNVFRLNSGAPLIGCCRQQSIVALLIKFVPRLCIQQKRWIFIFVGSCQFLPDPILLLSLITYVAKNCQLQFYIRSQRRNTFPSTAALGTFFPASSVVSLRSAADNLVHIFSVARKAQQISFSSVLMWKSLFVSVSVPKFVP